MKIGLLCCFYNCAKEIPEVLRPWLMLKGHEVSISVSHGMFQEYKDLYYEDNDNDTLETIQRFYKDKKIDYFYNSIQPETEAQVRNHSLEFLLTQNCDVIWLLDGDEYYRLSEIQNIISLVKTNPEIAWFYLNFKNYFGDGSKWVDGFCPSRIFQTQFKDLQLLRMYYDNDVCYSNSKQEVINYKNLPSLIIPKNVAHIRHLSWTNDKGLRKIEYQLRHFGGACSYRWNRSESQIELNEFYYKERGQPVPEVFIDELNSQDIRVEESAIGSD